MLVGLRKLNDVYVGYWGIMLDGYVLGEIILSRSSLIADIYFIYVHDKLRGVGNGAHWYQCFEDTVKQRGASVGVKISIVIRIPLKHCIVNSVISFWRKLGFEGFEHSICFIKNIK